jgi:hypothetical protein
MPWPFDNNREEYPDARCLTQTSDDSEDRCDDETTNMMKHNTRQGWTTLPVAIDGPSSGSVDFACLSRRARRKQD